MPLVLLDPQRCPYGTAELTNEKGGIKETFIFEEKNEDKKIRNFLAP